MMDPKTTVKIEILFDQATGAMSMSAPLNSKILCLGVLELAKKHVMDFDPTAADRRIIGATVLPNVPPPAPKKETANA